jgi:rhodanese-related sulfurtransferase
MSSSAPTVQAVRRRLSVLAWILLLPLVPATGAFIVQWKLGDVPKLLVHMPEVQAGEARKWEDVLWVDARPRKDYEKSHVEGAMWLDEGAWQEALPKLLDAWKPGRRVVVYCSSKSCQASQAVARRLHEETGWKDIFVVKGGWDSLKDFQGGVDNGSDN